MAGRSISVNATNGTFDIRSYQAEMYTVTAATYAPADGVTWVDLNDLHGVGAAAADTFLPTQVTSTIHYVKTGKIVSVQGYIVLDRNDANPIGTGTQEVRIRAQVPAASDPPAWGVQLPLPVRASRSGTADDEGPGASVPLLNVDLYDETDTRIDGGALVPSETEDPAAGTGTGPVKARILADGTLALVEVRMSDGGVDDDPTLALFVEPVVQVALTGARLATMVTWAEDTPATGAQARLVIYGQYECQ